MLGSEDYKNHIPQCYDKAEIIGIDNEKNRRINIGKRYYNYFLK